jgi:lipoprotein-releasing system ATP-binding protein
LTVIDVQHLDKIYPGADGPIVILSDLAFTLGTGDAAAIMGPSGSGKSTLLYILGTLDRPTAGSVRIDGDDPFVLDERGLAAFRNRTVGFMFQDHCLLPQCSVLENVLAPTLVSTPRPDTADRARRLLDRVGLGHRLDHRPAALSGGEKQRVALARALINQPRVLLCDEPTGNLDHRSAEVVAALLTELHREQGVTLVVVTHSAELARRLPCRFELVDGRLESRP